MVVRAREQRAEIWDGDVILESFQVSTAANGLGCEENSFCTPLGRLRVVQKVGEGEPLGAVFRSRIPTGELWKREEGFIADDLVTTRILWLEGMEARNANTRNRLIYLHGTNHEDKLGSPVSHGCIRFSNKDILKVYELLEVGCEVIVE